jgi:hypothetical protein
MNWQKLSNEPEPPLTHLKPPSRFGLAATTSNKIHHPLAQI